MDQKLKAAIKRKKSTPAAAAPPQIHIGAPQAHIAMDLKELTREVGQLSAAMVQLAKQQEAILKALEQQVQVLGVMAQRSVTVEGSKVEIPEIKIPALKMPPRPTEFDIEFQKDGNSTVGMRIRAARSH